MTFNPKLTYCTNVHALSHFSDWKKQIGFFGPEIASILEVKSLSLGLWFRQSLVREILSEKEPKLQELSEFMDSRNLGVFTLNAFPFGNFHERVVKKSVYIPNWCEESRLGYTLDCAALLSGLLGRENNYGSISTLPLGWREGFGETQMEAAARNLIRLSEGLRELFEKTGKQIRVCLEPEPGCALEFTSQVIEFWEKYLIPARQKFAGKSFPINDFLGVCYDTCHQAVQFEDPVESLKILKDSGIPIGKMQLSNALEFVPDAKKETSQLRNVYCEEKFLHQTRVKKESDVLHFDDLQDALISDGENWGYPWRTHYHIPLNVAEMTESRGLKNTLQDMYRALEFALSNELCRHFEVETYTWTVLPENMRPANPEQLALSIAGELKLAGKIIKEKSGFECLGFNKAGK